MNTTPGRAGFTLAELAVASAVSLLVVAMVLTALVKGLDVWQDGLDRLQLSRQSRLVRERILRGLPGPSGLRTAQRGHVTWADGELRFNDAGTALAIGLASNEPPTVTLGTNRYPVVPNAPAVQAASATVSGRVACLDLTLRAARGNRRRTQFQRIQVVLFNE